MSTAVLDEIVNAEDEAPFPILKAPFPWFGGKSRATELVWSFFGNTPNYVEPFAGSLAMVLRRPTPPKIETVNDKDCFLANFWRAIRSAPDEVAQHASWPVNECVPAGTMIATPDGLIPVEQIKAGMEVWGDKAGQVVRTTVIATKQSSAKEFYSVGDLLVTGNHPVWTAEAAYQEAQNLKAGLHVKQLDRIDNKTDLVILYSPLGKGSTENIRGDQQTSKSSSEKGLPLQRISLQVSVDVYNFQTTMGNYFADNILVHNCDLHSRHFWLINQEEFKERMKLDPEYYDTKIAGWWVWGLSAWIGGNWCGPQSIKKDGSRTLRPIPNIGNAGRGVHRSEPPLKGIHRPVPHLGNTGMGVHRIKPHLSDQGHGIHRTELSTGSDLPEYFELIAQRLRRVRVCCGDWKRVLTPSVTTRHGLTAVFLDPPYSAAADYSGAVYGENDFEVAHDVRKWAIENGENEQMRIALCGYEKEHAPHMPDNWICKEWHASKGYAAQRKEGNNENRKQERIWFSPHCLKEMLF